MKLPRSSNGRLKYGKNSDKSFSALDAAERDRANVRFPPVPAIRVGAAYGEAMFCAGHPILT
jgi:hypothetical protein